MPDKRVELDGKIYTVPQDATMDEIDVFIQNKTRSENAQKTQDYLTSQGSSPNDSKSWSDVAEKVTINDIYAAPFRGAANIVKSLYDDFTGTAKHALFGNFYEAGKAKDAFDQGDYLGTTAHGMAAAIPFAGPAAAAIGEQADANRPGDLVGNAAALFATPKATSVAKEYAPVVGAGIKEGLKSGLELTPARYHGFDLPFQVPKSLASGVAGAWGGQVLGSGVGAPQAGNLIGGTVGALSPMIRGAVKGGKAAYQEMQNTKAIPQTGAATNPLFPEKVPGTGGPLFPAIGPKEPRPWQRIPETAKPVTPEVSPTPAQLPSGRQVGPLPPQPPPPAAPPRIPAWANFKVEQPNNYVELPSNKPAQLPSGRKVGSILAQENPPVNTPKPEAPKPVIKEQELPPGHEAYYNEETTGLQNEMSLANRGVVAENIAKYLKANKISLEEAQQMTPEQQAAIGKLPLISKQKNYVPSPETWDRVIQILSTQ